MKITPIAISVALLGSAAQAQDTYAGVSFDYGVADNDNSQTVATLLGGATYDLGMMTLGGEVEYGASAVLGGDYDTARLRLLGGYDFGTLTALASIGGTSFSGDAGDFTGFNFGLGVQTQISNALDLRGEVIRDVMGEDGADATTGRIAAIYSF